MLEYSNGRRSAISGASLAQLRRNMSADERAILAADIIDGRVILQGLNRQVDRRLVRRERRLRRSSIAAHARAARASQARRPPAIAASAAAEQTRRSDRLGSDRR